MLYRNHKTNKTLRILTLLLALVCIFTIIDPTVYAMGQTENDGRQTEQTQEDKLEKADGQSGGVGDGDNDTDTNDTDTNDNGNIDQDKDVSDDDGDADQDKNTDGDGDTDPDKNTGDGNNDPDKGNDSDNNTDDTGNADPDGQTDDETDKEEPEENEKAAASVELFLAVNGAWKSVGSLSVDQEASGGRYYITAAELAETYGAYGFSTEAMSADLRIFPHTDKKNYDTLWADAKPYQTESGEWRVPLSTNIDNYLYYLPGNVDGSASFFAQKASRDDAAVLADNTFYTVSVSDTTGTEDAATGIYYVFNGTKFEITLSQHEEHEWRITNLIPATPLNRMKPRSRTTGKSSIHSMRLPAR